MNGLVQLGRYQEDLGLDTLGKVAEAERQRNNHNAGIERQKKQARVTGAISGAATGASVAGPWGALAGFFVGALSPDLF